MSLLQTVLVLLLAVSQLFQASPPEQARVVRVGVYDNPPMSSFVDGTAQGFVIDILNAVADEENWDLVYVPCDWSSCLEMIDAGEIDLLGPIAYSDERAKKYIFNDETYFTNWGVIYTRPGEKIETLLDLNGKTLAVLRGDVFCDAAMDLLDGFQSEPEYLFVEDYPSVLRAVAEGRAQAGVANRLFGQLHAADFDVVKTPVIFNPIAVRFAIPKTGDPSLLAAIDHRLKDWKGREGSPYTRAVDRWLAAAQPDSEPPAWVIPTLVVLVGIIILALVTIGGLRGTVRKRTAELKASEARTNVLLQNMPDLLFKIDKDGVFLDYWNATNAPLFAPPETFLGHKITEVLPADIAQEAMQRIIRTLETGEVQSHEYRLTMPEEGGDQFFEARYLPEGDDAVTAIVRDITQRVQAEEALRRSETLFRAVITQSRDGVSLVDQAGNYVLVNPAFCQMTGYASDELLNMNMRDLLPPDLDLTLFPRIWDGRTGGVVEVELVKKDGTRFWTEVAVDILRLGEQNLAIGIVHDITERKQAEMRIQESEERLRTLINATPDIICFKDESGRWLEANQADLELFQLTDVDYRGKTDAELAAYTHPIYRDSFLMCEESDERAWAAQIISRGEEIIPRPDGLVKIYDVIKVPLFNPDGSRKGLIVLGRDITERKQAEEKLRQSEESYRDLYNYATSAIYIQDREGRFVDVNEGAIAMYGYPREFFIGKMPDFLSAPGKNDLAKVGRHIEKAFAGEPQQFEFWGLRQNGEIFPKIVRLQRGKYFGQEVVIAFALDITERKQAEEALQKYTNQLEILTTVMTALTASLSLDEVLNLILEQIRLVVPMDSAAVFLREGENLRVVIDWGISPSAAGRLLPGDDELFDEVQAQRAPLIVDNPLKNPRFSNWGGSEAIKTWMGVPLIVRDTLIGFMTLDSDRSRAYSAEQIRLVNSFAAQAAQAIDNAIQFRSAQRRLHYLSALREIDQAISRETELNRTLDILLEHVIRQLEVDAAAVLLYRPEGDRLEFAAGRGFRTPVEHLPDLGMENGFARTVLLERQLVQVPNLDEIDTASLCSPEFRAEAFIVYFGVPLIAKGNPVGVLEVYHRSALDPDEEWVTFLEMLAGEAAIAIDNLNLFASLERTNQDLIRAYDATIEGWAHALELRDMETEGHSRRVVDLTLALARKMGITDETELTHIRRGALLHDIGKMGVPDAILNKPGPLTEEEWEIMRQHPTYAYEMLSSISYLVPALDIPHSHHEKWDGSGYPRGLKGEEIPLAARIFTVVDVWDALGSDRSYRSAWPVERRLDYLRTLAGAHFDPRVVAAFIELLGEQE